MRKYAFLLLLWGVCYTVQATNGFVPLKYWVSFTDKKDSEYTLNKPGDYLSKRSIDRRVKQNIAIDSTDLPVNNSYIDSILIDTTVTILYTSKWFNAALVKIPGQSSLERIQNLGFVKETLYVKPRLPVEYSADKDTTISKVRNKDQNLQESLVVHNWSSPVDELYISERDPEYGYAYDQINLLNGISLHNKGYTGKGILIALMDAGYNNTNTIGAFSHLWGDGRIVGWYDFVDPRGEIFNTHPHGTMVLSVMAGYKPNKFKGMAPGAEYLLLRSEDAGSEFLIEECNWIAAAEYADSIGADVINTSLGYTVFDDPAQNHSYEDMDGQTTLISRAANYAFNKGMLVVNSAGNYGERDWRYISAPADSHKGIAVGAVDNEGEKAGFSSIGPSYDNRIKPDIMAVGKDATVINVNGEITQANGTSFSSPQIAGLAACLWQSQPHHNVENIKKAIIQSAHRAHYPSNMTGFGMPDFEKAYQLLVNDFERKPLVKVFPNPFTSNFQISVYLENNDQIEIELINTQGQILHATSYKTIAGYNTFTPFMNLGYAPAGIYLLRVKTGNSVYTTRVLKAG